MVLIIARFYVLNYFLSSDHLKCISLGCLIVLLINIVY